jgi:hypothetical protein
MAKTSNSRIARLETRVTGVETDVKHIKTLIMNPAKFWVTGLVCIPKAAYEGVKSWINS